MSLDAAPDLRIITPQRPRLISCEDSYEVGCITGYWAGRDAAIREIVERLRDDGPYRTWFSRYVRTDRARRFSSAAAVAAAYIEETMCDAA